nr:hypothetical protein [Tanacetum cinerariifolium]
MMSNNNMQTQTSNTLYNVIMEADSKDRPPMLAPVDACPNACEMWKAIERLKQGESINVQDLETNLYWEFGKFTSQDGESLESYFLRFYKMMNELIRNQCKVTNHQVNVQFLLQLQPEWQRFVTLVKQSQELKTVSYHKLYDILKQHQHGVNEIRAEKIAHVANPLVLVAQQQPDYHPQTHPTHYTQNSSTRSQQADNSLRINRNAGYENQRIGNVVGARETVGSSVVSPDAADFGPIFDDEPLQKDVIIDSLDMSYDREEIEQNDDDNDLTKERELLASLIKKLKCEIDESKNCNKFLETSNKVLIEKLKGEIEDFKNKYKSLESSNNFFKEANNKLSETNNLLYADYKKSEAELARRNSTEYASQMEHECAKVRGDSLSYKMHFQKSCTKHTDTINALNQTISEMKNKLSAHQETISILSKQKEDQIKLYKTREDKELDKVIELENKVKVLDNIVYKTDQSVQTINMHNNKCRTSFAKPESLKKAQRANPRLYDIGCYNDNLALMLAPDSDEVIRLEKESQSKLSDLIRPFDYDKLNNLYDLFVPQRDKSSEQHEVTNLQCDYLELLEKCEGLETELSKSKMMSKSFESVQKHAINLELELQQCKEKIKNDMLFKVNKTKDFCKERAQYFKIQDLKAQLQYKGIVISLETELSKSKMMSKSFESVQKHAINLELELQQCKEKIKNDMLFKVNKTKDFCKERAQYFKIQDLKAQLQDKGIVISELKKLLEKIKGKSVDTKFEKSSVIRQPNAFKSQRTSVLGKPTTFSNSFVRKDFLKSTSVTQTHVSNDFSKPVTAQTLPTNKNSILKNKNVLAPGMYKIHTYHTQTRTSQLTQDSRKTNKHMSFSTGVIPTTSVSRTQLKSNPQGDRVMHNNNQGKKQEVEDHRRSVKLYKNKTSVTACNDNLNAKTWNIKSVFAIMLCVLKSDVKPLKKTVASESNKKPRNFTRKLYERVSKTCNWWYPKFTPSGYKWKPKFGNENVNLNVSMPLGNASRSANVIDTMTSRHSIVSNTPLSFNSFAARRDFPIHRRLWLVEIVLFIVDSGCSKHMTENLKLLINFVEKFLGAIKFGNDQIAPILGYGDLVQGAVTIKRVYYVEGLNHNLFSIGQFCDADLEVAFRKSTCYIRDLKGNNLLTGIHHQTSVARTPEQNGVVKRRNRTLVEAARTMLSAAKVSLFFWAEAIATMASDQISSDPAPECQTMALNHDSLSPVIQCQANVPQADRTVTTSNELDLLFSPMFDELLNGSSKVVSKCSAVSAADAPYQRQNHTTPLNIHSTHAPTCQVPTHASTVSSSENINQAETYAENDQVADD